MRHLIVFALFVLTAVGCGRGEPPSCSGSSCSCVAMRTCDVRQEDCGGGECSISCEAQSACRGSCGASCDVACAADSSCEMTVGQGASVSCSSGSDCQIQCTGACSLSCGSGSRCSLRCSGDTSARTVDGSASCS